MKRFPIVLAAAALALVFAAQAPARTDPGIVSIQPYAWVKTLLRAHPRNPKPIHRLPTTRTSMSLYERTTKQWILRHQGCAAGRSNLNGIVILDFGKLAYNGHTYGTILFSDRFVGNRLITRAMLAYAAGYNRCLPKGSLARISLARGTSNYHPAVPSAYEAGRTWAREVSTLAHLLYYRNLDGHVWSAAADDAEPAWDPVFHDTRDFFLGYRHTGVGRPLYDYGSLDGGVGAHWNARQAFFVAGGMKYARAIPEIYNRAMAREWAVLARIAIRRFHRPVRFAGVMTQLSPGCGCSLRPAVARRVLLSELGRRSVRRRSWVPGVYLNIRSAY